MVLIFISLFQFKNIVSKERTYCVKHIVHFLTFMLKLLNQFCQYFKIILIVYYTDLWSDSIIYFRLFLPPETKVLKILNCSINNKLFHKHERLTTWRDLALLFIFQFLYQCLSFGMIVSSALMIWKGLMVVTGSESPIVVVLRYYIYFKNYFSLIMKSKVNFKRITCLFFFFVY